MAMRLELTDDEALVGMDWLARFNASAASTSFEDQAEQRVLWDLEAMLERSVGAVTDPRYGERLVEARARVRDN
jgi:hypothetical protein